jgi:hypothetical protein
MEQKHDYFTSPGRHRIHGCRNTEFCSTRSCANSEQIFEISSRLSGRAQGKSELWRLHEFPAAIGLQSRGEPHRTNRLVPAVSNDLIRAGDQYQLGSFESGG